MYFYRYFVLNGYNYGYNYGYKLTLESNILISTHSITNMTQLGLNIAFY